MLASFAVVCRPLVPPATGTGEPGEPSAMDVSDKEDDAGMLDACLILCCAVMLQLRFDMFLE